MEARHAAAGSGTALVLAPPTTPDPLRALPVSAATGIGSPDTAPWNLALFQVVETADEAPPAAYPGIAAAAEGLGLILGHSEAEAKLQSLEVLARLYQLEAPPRTRNPAMALGV